MSIEYKTSFFNDKVVLVDEEDGICLRMTGEKFKKLGHQGIVEELQVIKSKNVVSTAYKNERINTVYLFVTNKCNLQCDFCSMRSDNKSIDKESLEWDKPNSKLFLKLKELSPRKLIISGGEPLLFSDLSELLKKLKEEIDSKIIIQSNGWLLTSEKIQAIKDYVDSVELSTSHIKDLNHLESVVNQLRENDIDVVLTFIYEKKEDISKMNTIMDMAAVYDTDFLLHFVDYAGSAADNNHPILDSYDRLEVYNKYVDYILKKGYEDKRFAEGLFVPILPSHPCSAYGKMVAIFPDGNIFMCHSLKEESYRLCSVEDDESIIQRIEEKKSDEFIRQQFDLNNCEKCKECKFNLICGGFCPNLVSNEELQDCDLRKIMFLFNLFIFNYNENPQTNLVKFKNYCNKKEYAKYL